MNKLAGFIMAGRWQAIGTVTGFALLGLVVPPLTLLSGAALGLVSLRAGASNAVSVLGLSVLALAIASLIGAGQAWIGAIYGLTLLAPLMLLALILRSTVSLAKTLQAATAFGIAVLLAIKYLTPDIDSLWSAMLDELVRPALARAEMPASAIDTMLEQAARIMTGSVIAALLLSLGLTLLMARWWQALLYNPGGFREEFTGLQLGYPAAGLALALAAGAMLTKISLMIELAMVASVMFFLQGMAVTHAVVGQTAYPSLWLAGIYGLLILAMPQMMAGLSLTGAIDAFVDFRARLRREKPGRD
jgi:hypothetical protein